MTLTPLTDLYPSPFVAAFLDDPTQLYPHYRQPANVPEHPVVVAGQQVGLFGGPLYTLLKIRSAVQAAEDLSREYGRAVQPVFWLEDNDSDAAEASTVWLPEPDGSLARHTLNAQSTRTPVGLLRFSAEDVEQLDAWIHTINGRGADEVQQTLRAAYTIGRSWADAFEDILRPFLEAWQVSVIRGSDLILKGAHYDLIARDLTSSELIDAIRATSERLQRSGFSLQAEVPDALFFLVVNGQRQRLERVEGGFHTPDGTHWPTQKLLDILSREPERFLPNVMGRPLVQDLALPNIATVLGAAELAYHAQLADVYQLIGRSQPTPVLRHHGAVLDSKAERLLDKLQLDTNHLYRPWQDIEADAVAEEVSDALDGLDNTSALDSLVAPFIAAAHDIDPTLVKSVHAAQAAIEKNLDGVRAKLRTAVKRSHQDRLDRLRSLWWMVYPNGTVSERILPLATWVSRLGQSELRIIAERICSQSRNQFVEIGVSDIEST